MIFIVVFSEEYASSTWCLEELVEILRCVDTIDHTLILHIFYHVKLSDVQKQTGTFAKAFARYEKTDMNKVQRWREALIKAASFSGWVLDVANG